MHCKTLHCIHLKLWSNEGERFTTLKYDTTKTRLLAYFENFYHDPFRPQLYYLLMFWAKN